MTQRRVADLTVVVAVDFRVGAAYLLYLLEDLSSAPHLLYGVRRQQIIVDLTDMKIQPADIFIIMIIHDVFIIGVILIRNNHCVIFYI